MFLTPTSRLPRLTGSLEDTLRMIAPAIMRRRVQRGMHWLRNPSGNTRFSDTFLIAHGFMQDEIAPKSALSFVWKEADAPSPLRFASNLQ